jgi:hypothetical protein
MIGYGVSYTRLWQLKEQGCEFFHQDFYSIADTASINFLIDYNKHTSGKQQIIVIPGYFHSTYGPVEIQIYRGSEYTGGVAVPFYCTNTDINNVMETEVTIGASGDNKGTQTEGRIAGTGATNQSSGGASTQFGTEFIRGGGKTLIEITNKSGKTTQVTYGQIFYEE